MSVLLIQECYARFKAKVRENLASHLASICDILSLKYTKPPNFASWRWLVVYDVAISFNYLRMAYMVFYYTFLSEKDQTKYKYRIKNILIDRCITSKEAKIEELQASIASKCRSSTDKGRERKSRIS